MTIHVHDLPDEVRLRLDDFSPAVDCNEHQVMLNPNNPALQETVLRTLLNAHVEIVALEPLERPLEHVYLEAIRLVSSGTWGASKRKALNQRPAAPPMLPAVAPPLPPLPPLPVELEKKGPPC
ncbi:MAG: hypothetical protein HC884_19090 [Chloroflexaceae bacterium]|nr:hypothetical protein [Chloroflexaceae bacterium]